jgi:hypothetical protein
VEIRNGYAAALFHWDKINLKVFEKKVGPEENI